MSPSSRHHDCVIYVVDDDQASRVSVAAFIGAHGYHVRTFESAEAFLVVFDGTTCGVVISDYRMPGMNGLELQQRLAERDLAVPMIMVSGYADVATAVNALRGGALTLLEKPYEQSMLLDAVHEAVGVAQDWFRARRRNEDAQLRLATLNDGERDVMHLILDGHVNKTIAARLDVSLRTVERRRHDILGKLGVESLMDLAEVIKQSGSRPWRIPARGMPLASLALTAAAENNVA